ncbi:GntR family transcriptional regulator, histidine utilization repressor [Desulfocicer vacuolatum DSM 3385]|uniref:Histidine utilization repressor n=1 Tax=Desulfocicer vacuolatum DSM 3385 TaxID=1121400 RepID=A0A1W2CB99_9BACT|nr:histidine utilization repressor [Desulfocicer vacuolatum]SMC82152.1 GntR family transcriptional regulator, histidine utilization repressor [Desulfocicer vacuolatum DSM 3385]
MTTLSHSGPKPLYEQVKEFILQQIKTEVWLPDARIPSENELVKLLKVSRITVNRALRELTDSGDLVRVQGVGTYVAHPKPLTSLFEISSIDEEIIQRGGIYSCKIHMNTMEKAYPELAAAMEIEIDTPVFHSIIVHKSNDKPVMLEDQFIHPLSAPEFLKQDFSKISPVAYLLKTIQIKDVEHIIEALNPDEMAQELLNLSPHDPCLILHRQTWDSHRVATHSRMTYPGTAHRMGARLKPLFKNYVEQYGKNKSNKKRNKK